MQLAEIAHEVRVRTQAHLLQNLLHRKKGGPQHQLRLSQTIIFEVLGRACSGFLFEEMAKARWREIYQSSERRSVPRAHGFGFHFGYGEFYSSIHRDEDAETKSRVRVLAGNSFVYRKIFPAKAQRRAKAQSAAGFTKSHFALLV